MESLPSGRAEAPQPMFPTVTVPGTEWYCTGSYPAETVPVQHRMQHAIAAQREAAAARRLDVLMLALPRTDPRRHSWLEAGDAAQIAGRWLASHPSERLGLVCACARAASSARCSSPIWAWIAQRLRLRAFWALRSRHTAVGGWAPAVRRRCRRLGGRACADARDGWRYTHDYIASTVFDLVSLAGISGTMEPRGIFSMAVAWLFRPRSWPRMVAVARGPALSQTIASRSSVVACVMIACISGNDSVYVYRLERPLPGLFGSSPDPPPRHRGS